VKTTLSEREGNTVKLAVEVSVEELREAFDNRLKQVAREARIPGFRQGKVPAAMLRERLGDEAILADTIEETMSNWLASALLDLGLDPVDRPTIDMEDEAPELGKALAFTATMTVMPEVVLGEYKGIEAIRESDEVEDQDVSAQMERLRNQFAELRPITSRPAQTGDFVTADFRAGLDGEEVQGLTASDFVFEVGGGRLLPEIEEQAVGMSPSEEKTFDISMPEDYGDDELAGKTVEFIIVVKEIKEKVLPPVSDKWVSEVSEFGTLLELRQDIRKKLKAGKKYAADQRFRSAAVRKAAENATLDLPAVVVREQAEEMLSDFKQSLEAQGGTLDAYLQMADTTVEQMIEDLSPDAARNVKTGLVLDAVAKAESIAATDAEVIAVVKQMATGAKVDPADFERRLRKSGRLEPIRWQLVRDKAADFIVANAVAVAPTEEADAEEPKQAAEAVPPEEADEAEGANESTQTSAGPSDEEVA